MQIRLRSQLVGHNPQSATPTTIAGQARIDLDNDNSFEFDQALDGIRHLRNLVATIGPTGRLDIGIETRARLASTDLIAAAYSMTLDVNFEPVREILSSVAPYGSCGPDVYGVSWDAGPDRFVRLVLEGAAPNNAGLLLLGLDRIRFAIPGIQCDLLTTPIARLPVQTDPTGRVITDFPGFPMPLLLDIKFQYATLGTTIQLSKAVEYRVFRDHADPYRHYELNHILSTGQSLAIGGLGSPVLSSTQPLQNLMFGTGLSSVSSTLSPLVEDFWETMSSGLSSLASTLYQTPHNNTGTPPPTNRHDTLISIHASAGYPYSLLRKGTANFAQGISQFRTARSIAEKQNKSYIVRCVTNVHGETDHAFQNPDYTNNLIDWQRDYEQAIQSNGQTDPVPMLHSQMSSFTRYQAATSLIPPAQFEASKQYPRKLPLVMPKYFLSYFDGIHLTSQGYRHMGEYYGKVYNYVVLEGSCWEPLRPLDARLDGNVVYVRFHVPEPPIVLDTVLVSDPGNFGFEYDDDSGQTPSVTGVRVVDEDTVALTLSGTPSAGARKFVGYAFTGIVGALGGPMTGARGCVRDSDATPSRHNGPLYNWAVHFRVGVR